MTNGGQNARVKKCKICARGEDEEVLSRMNVPYKQTYMTVNKTTTLTLQYICWPHLGG